MTNYPARIDTSISLPLAVDNLTPVAGVTVNRLRKAILAIESELGVKPSGVYSNVAGRLSALEDSTGNLQIISLSGDLGNSLATPFVIGIQGRPISSATPNMGESLTWNGIAWAPSAVAGSIVFSNDLSGNNVSQTVIGLRGRPLSSAAPTIGQSIIWDGSQWTPSNSSGNGNITSITNSYLVVPTDYIIAVGSIAGSISVTLEASPFIGRTVVVKDTVGTGQSKTITVSGNGHNIDGAPSYVINQNYASLTLVYVGLQWSVI